MKAPISVCAPINSTGGKLAGSKAVTLPASRIVPGGRPVRALAWRPSFLGCRRHGGLVFIRVLFYALVLLFFARPARREMYGWRTRYPLAKARGAPVLADRRGRACA